MSACTNCNYHVMLFFTGTTVKFGCQPEMGILQVRDTALQSHFHACRIGSLSRVHVFSMCSLIFIFESVQINQHQDN